MIEKDPEIDTQINQAEPPPLVPGLDIEITKQDSSEETGQTRSDQIAFIPEDNIERRGE